MKLLWGKNRGQGERLRAASVLTALTLVAGVGLSGCTISVPVEPPATEVKTTPNPSFAAPTTKAGHDAAAIARKNMDFPAGNKLSENVPVTFADKLGESESDFASTPKPAEWKVLLANVAGQTQYSNKAGCMISYWTTRNQGPLITAGDDKQSTVAMFQYLIPSVVPTALKDATWPWVAEAGKKGPNISFLKYTTKAGKGVKVSAVYARMLGTSNTGLMITISCPTDALLTSTTPRIMSKLSVAPPTE